MSFSTFVLKQLNRSFCLCILLFACMAGMRAQSLDASTPAPIHSSSVQGRISPRDLGDARLTDHFYAFTGTPGDLLITVQSRNLNGDIDVFTAGTLRPLLKMTIYAELTTPITKGLYLRRRENLILRVQARTPNDDEGTYEFTFAGSFEPIVGGIETVDGDAAAATTSAIPGKKGRRVSSVGARINEPPPEPSEIAVVPGPEPIAAATPAESPAPDTTGEVKPTKPPVTRTPPQSARSRTSTSRRNPPTSRPNPQPVENAKSTEGTKKEEENTEPKTEVAPTTPKPKPVGRSNTRRSGTTARAAKPQPQPAAPTEPEPEIGPRLIIETNDGTLINRSMGGVRRVTIENGQVLVVGKDGKIDRILLANIVRMQIQP